MGNTDSTETRTDESSATFAEQVDDVSPSQPPPTTVCASLVPANQYDTGILPHIIPLIRVVPDTLASTLFWISTSLKHLFVGPEYDKTKVTDAIVKLQSTLTFLDTKMNQLNENVLKYTCEAKRLYTCKNKPAALHQLRLKKMYEREVAKMDSLKFNIESNILHMESVGVMMETVSTIKETSHQFQLVSRHVDIDRLEDSIEEMFEQRDTSKDIETILNDMHDSHDYDEDDLMDELESLVAEDLERGVDDTTTTTTQHPPPETPSNANILSMPEAPTTAIHPIRPIRMNSGGSTSETMFPSSTARAVLVS